MTDKKICFIYCINDKKQYFQSLRYLNSLEVPFGFTIECISIEMAPSITAGYNFAMKKTDAKYKVYLHQDVNILNKNFIYDCINLFNANKKLGLLGVVGAKDVPANGIWWESNEKYGKVYDSHTGTMSLLQFQNVNKSYEPVKAIDGLIMITQYDVPWREDIFKGWHYYDLSQCYEFQTLGYDVGVPRQEVPWCEHDCGIVNVLNGFEENRKKFIKSYMEGEGSGKNN